MQDTFERDLSNKTETHSTMNAGNNFQINSFNNYYKTMNYFR